MSTALANAFEAHLGGRFPANIAGAEHVSILPGGRCICGHELGSQFMVQVPGHANLLPIGSTCIARVMKHAAETANEALRAEWEPIDAARRVAHNMRRRAPKVLERARLCYSWPVPTPVQWARMTQDDKVIVLATARLLHPEDTAALETLLRCCGQAGLVSIELATDIVKYQLLDKRRFMRPALQRHLLELLGGRDLRVRLAELSGQADAAGERLEQRRQKCVCHLHKHSKEFQAMAKWRSKNDWDVEETEMLATLHKGCELISVDVVEKVAQKVSRGATRIVEHVPRAMARVVTPGVIVVRDGRPVCWHGRRYQRGPGQAGQPAVRGPLEPAGVPGRILFDCGILFK
jgi:hypothetical protein